MKFQIGDKVLLLLSGEEGEIVSEINREMVLVEVQGVQFPVYKDQIDHPYFKKFSEKKAPISAKRPKQVIENLKKEKLTLDRYQVGEGLWLSFLPVFEKDVFDEDVVDYFKLYLVNQTREDHQFHYKVISNGNLLFELKNEIKAMNDFYLNNVALDDMNDAPRFLLEFTPLKPSKTQVAFYEVQVKLKPKQLFQKIEELLFEHKASFSMPLFTHYPEKVPEEKLPLDSLYKAGYRVSNSGKAHHHLPPARTMVDLHLEKLTDRPGDLSAADAITLQLDTFEKFYDLAILHHQPYLVVVHGIGSGKLKNEIHERLRHKKEVKSFVNQFHPSYGYGATEIYFHYSSR